MKKFNKSLFGKRISGVVGIVLTFVLVPVFVYTYLSILVFVAITIAAVVIILWPEKEKKEFWCCICHSLECNIRLHRRMAENAIKYKISDWAHYSDVSKRILAQNGHFECRTFRINFESTEKLLKNGHIYEFDNHDRENIEEAKKDRIREKEAKWAKEARKGNYAFHYLCARIGINRR